MDQHVWGRCGYIRNIFWKKMISCFSKTWVGQLNCWKRVIVRNSKSYRKNSNMNFFARFFSGGLPWDMWGYPSLYLMVLSSIVLSILNWFDLSLKFAWKFLIFLFLFPDVIKVYNRSTNVTSRIISVKHYWMAITNDNDPLNNELGLEITVN